MIDPYANYFCQRLFNCLNNDLRLFYLSKIRDHLSFIGKNKIGTYPLQSIIESLKNDEEKKVVIIGIKNHDFLEMCIDTQGIHVVEKIVTGFGENLIPHIYEFLINNFMALAMHSNAIGVIKKMIKNAKFESTLLRIQKIVLDNYMLLINNMYGNYVIQVALESWSMESILPILNSFNGKFYEFSLNKFSSNVVEKCLEHGGDFVISKFIEEINYKTKVVDLMKNNFGNFVVQKALKMSNDKNLLRLIQLINKNLEKIGEKKLISKWKSIIQSHDRFANCNTSINNNANNSVLNDCAEINTSKRIEY